MAGVAGPMYVRDRHGGLRFIAGLLIGESASSLVVAAVVFTLGQFVRHQVAAFSAVGLAAVITVLGVSDLLGRTPQLSRQVPQRLIHRLPAGRLGLVWGLDLGLLVTTRKTTSLTWIVLLIALVRPAPSMFVVPATMALVSVAITWVRARRWRSDDLIRNPVRYRLWFRTLTRLIGLASAVVGMMILVSNL